MKYAIFGAGAMGAQLGALLHKAGQDVWLINRNESHVQAIRENGLIIEKNGVAERFAVLATTDPAEVGEADVVIVLVKGAATGEALPQLRLLFGPDTTVLTLQNGYGNADLLEAEFGQEHVAYGCLGMAGRVVGPGHVAASAAKDGARIDFGSHCAALEPKLRTVADHLAQDGVRASYSADIDRLVWKKLAINCGDNACCAILRCGLDLWHALPSGVELAYEIRKEVCAVAKAKGIRLDLEDLPAPVCVPLEESSLGGHLTSTLDDVLRKRPTEKDTLNGAIVREGQKYGIATPYNHAVWLMMNVVEASYGQTV